ncbi:MAG: hypothetical protein IKR13_02095 [Victivallales bacterium]|nr:hypothetical protein [Victivallales bacterium]
MMQPEILYFTQDPESPCSQAVRQRAGVVTLQPEDDFSQYIGTIKAAIVDVAGEIRGTLLKALLKEKIPFAVNGLAGETPDSLKKICAAAKRRHIQVCWLGSLRFEWVMARFKEFLTSGVLGSLQELRLTRNPAEGIFESLKDEDLTSWLLQGNETAYYCDEVETDDYTLVATGAHGTATAMIHADGANELRIELANEPVRILKEESHPREAEIGYFLFAIHTGRPWTMLGRIPN